MSQSTTRPLMKELLEIPERIHHGDFVLKLSEGVQRPEATLKDYVVTEALKEHFDDALSFIERAVERKESKAAFLHGSFGSGKSHFMAVLHLLLNRHPAARAHPDLSPLVLKHPGLEGKRFLLLPFHMIGAESMESAVLGGYVEQILQLHPSAPTPPVYLSEDLFRDARKMREEVGDDKFFARLNESMASANKGWGKLTTARWNPETFEAALHAEANDRNRLDLLSALLGSFFTSYKSVIRERTENYVSFDRGLAQISRHASELKDENGKGYDGLILFLDELVLWLASRAADLAFVHREMDKVVKLIEAQHSDRPIPIISFVARQRDLRDLVSEHLSGSEAFNFSDALKHQEGRFHVIELEDSNLPEIIAKRILRPRSEAAREQLEKAFGGLRFRDDVKDVLLTSRYTLETFKKIYPFSPALVETLVAVSSLLQRNRTAIRILMDLLIGQRDSLEVGELIPVGDLFEYVSRNWEAYNRSIKEAYQSAVALYENRFRPILERTHPVDPITGERPPAFRNDERLVHTLLLSALVPQVEALRGLTPQRLAALNHGTIRMPPGGSAQQAVLTKLRNWQPDIGELRIEDGTDMITLNLTSVDVEAILEKVRGEDNASNRKRKVRDILFAEMGIRENAQGQFSDQFTYFWRGSQRSVEISYLNVRDQNLGDLAADPALPRLIVDYPFDDPNYGPRDDLNRLRAYREEDQPDTRTIVWLPRFLAPNILRDLGRLVLVEHVLSGDRFETQTSHLSANDKPAARQQLDSLRTSLRARVKQALEMSYGVVPVQPGYLIEEGQQLELDEQFQSLHRSFQPRPVTASNLAGAMLHLLHQELAAHFPEHPDFQFEREVPAAMVRNLWQDLQPAFETNQERILVEDKAARERLRNVAVPLKLVEMGETHFRLAEHWKRHFQQELYKFNDPLKVSLRQLHAWTDQPKAMGLHPRLRNLVAMVFAYQTNRNLTRAERVLENPDPDTLASDVELIPQDLPSPEEWSTALERARLLLDKLPPMSRTVSNTNRLAQRLREALSSYRQSAESLPGELSELAHTLGIEPDGLARLNTARAGRSLVELVEEKDSLQLLKRLAALELENPAAVLHALAQGRPLLEAFGRLNHDISRVLQERAQSGQPEAQELVQAVCEALQHEEIGHALQPALLRLQRESAAIISRPYPPIVVEPGAGPTPPSPPPSHPKKKRIAHKTYVGLSASSCLQKLDELRTKVEQGEVQVDLTWTIWKEQA